ncbi:MAG TPA: hypothetical protein VIK57_17165 [Streptosporangiaceae bacterium]
MTVGAIVAVIVVVIIVAAILVAVSAANRRRRLRERFGPEYDRAVTEHGSRREAESELAGRERHVRDLDLRPLSPAARSQYTSEWTAVQEQFVDAPQAAVTGAQTLVSAVMQDRGYPTQPYDQTLADLSVEHAKTLDHFRAAHDISQNAAAGTATTEDLRQAMIHYRALFAELLGEPAARPDAKASGDPATSRPDGLPAAEEPVVDQPAAEEPLAEEPVAEEPLVGQPAAEQPVAEEPVSADQSAVPAAPVSPAAGDTTSQPSGNPARNRTPDAVTTARQQER